MEEEEEEEGSAIAKGSDDNPIIECPRISKSGKIRRNSNAALRLRLPKKNQEKDPGPPPPVGPDALGIPRS